MIRSFKDTETEKVYTREGSRKLPNATNINDLRVPPKNRLEKLYKDRAGQHSIRINDQWRICFVCRDGDAYEVEITDYH